MNIGYADTLGSNAPQSLSVPNGDEVSTDGVEYKILNATQPKITQKQLARTTGLLERTISREIKQLGDSGRIRRVGSDRAG